MTAEEKRTATLDDEHISIISELILYSWPLTKAGVLKDLQPYVSFRDEITMIDGTAMKGRSIIIPRALQDKA